MSGNLELGNLNLPIHITDTNANVPTCGATYVSTETGKGSQQFISRMEMPRLQAGDIFIVHQSTDITSRPVNYSVAYDAGKQHSRWVAFRFDATMNQKKVARKDYSIRPQSTFELFSFLEVSSISF